MALLGLVYALSVGVAGAASTPHGTCAAAKLKAAAKKTAAKLKCYSGAIKRARAVDLGCLLEAEQKFGTAFAKAEAKGECIATGDADAVESDVDLGVGSLVADEPGGPTDDWIALIGRTWSMPAGPREGYRCRRIRIGSDMYLKAFRPVSPPGVFAMFVTVSPSTSSPLGDYDCSAGSLDQRLIYASGLGTGDFEFPLDVGVHLHAGDYVNLNVFLANGDPKPVQGIAGVLARTGSASTVHQDATMLLSGTFNISIPSDGQPHTAGGGCVWEHESQLVGVWPHLHSRGTHVEMTITHGASPTTVLDQPYVLDQQPIIPTSFALHTSDSVQTTCTYVNDTGHTIYFGEFLEGEQCFVGMYVWPSDGLSIFDCAS
jgi:hypothetical protein